MLKFQSENTYRGKKGNRCWCLPESVLKKLITQFYIKDKASTAIVQKGGRQELCDLLMSSVAKSFGKFGVNNINPNLTEEDNNNNNQSFKGKAMKMEKNPFSNNNNTNSGLIININLDVHLFSIFRNLSIYTLTLNKTAFSVIL